MSSGTSDSEGPLWEVRQSAIHRRGVFASGPIPKGTRIIEYIGERVTKAESVRRCEAMIERSRITGEGAVYMFELNKRHDIDGDVPNNPAKYINHSCRPNCETEIVRGRIWVVARRNIRPEEELTFDYGYDIEHYRDHPCRCGAPNCVGYIVRTGQRPRLRRLLEAENG